MVKHSGKWAFIPEIWASKMLVKVYGGIGNAGKLNKQNSDYRGHITKLGDCVTFGRGKTRYPIDKSFHHKTLVPVSQIDALQCDFRALNELMDSTSLDVINRFMEKYPGLWKRFALQVVFVDITPTTVPVEKQGIIFRFVYHLEERKTGARKVRLKC